MNIHFKNIQLFEMKIPQITKDSDVITITLSNKVLFEFFNVARISALLFCRFIRNLNMTLF